MSGNSRSREFPGIPASNSRPESREWNLPLAFPFPKMGMEFSICIPVPVNGNEIFLGFPGNFPFPKVGNGIFYLFAFPFPKMGMEFAIHIHIPVPENGNGICHFPFPFPKSKSHSRSWLSNTLSVFQKFCFSRICNSKQISVSQWLVSDTLNVLQVLQSFALQTFASKNNFCSSNLNI